jgi:hypothetical protein
MTRRLPFIAFLLAVAILAGLAIFGSQYSDDFATPPPSAEVRGFFNRCEQVRSDISEADVDRIFVDDLSGTMEKLDQDEADPSTPRYRKWYCSVADPSGGRYAIGVDFQAGRVVGKQIGHIE